MSEQTEDLQREAANARERLFASLEKLDERAHRVAGDAAEATRAGAWGIAAVVLFWAGTAFARRSARPRPVRARISHTRSAALVLARGALGGAALGFGYLATKAWLYAFQHAQRARLPYAPHLRQLGAPAPAALPIPASRALLAGGTSHALTERTNSLDGEDHA